MIEALEIKAFMVFNLAFANNTILSCLFFLIIDLYFLIPTVTVQFFNPNAELTTPYQLIPTKVIPTNISKCKYMLNAADRNCK